MKKILVTGGLGFLGSHLCKNLLKFKNNHVICVDNQFTGDIQNVAEIINFKNFQFIDHDITLPLDLDVDDIYNFACPASPIHYQSNPVQTIKTAVIGTINLLELAKKRKSRLLQASTSEIYGDPLVHPQKETYWGNVNTIGPRSCYDEGKRCSETLCYDYKRQYNVDTRIVRIFNTYGPYMKKNDGRVVSNFINQAIKNKPLTLYGNGKQTRSFCYVDDLISAINSVMKIKKKINNPINLGNPREYTMLDLAKKIIKKTKSNSIILFKELPADDPKKRKPDISLAKKILNWKPEVNLDRGLNKTISYFKNI